MEFSNTITCSHYNNKQKILLVGEGDFSFSLCLAKAFGSATNITATSLDTREELEQKYRDAKNNVEELERRGCTVIHGVNVHSMDKDHRVVRSIVYDRIIFNFPHAGFHFGREIDSYTILLHQELVRGFLKNAKKMVKDKDGEIHTTHKTAHPFSDDWTIEGLAKENGLCMTQETPRTCKRVGKKNARVLVKDEDGRGEIHVVHKTEYPFMEVTVTPAPLVGKSSTFMFYLLKNNFQ
ncbi:hypothetical protein Bca52824_022240 [Brassica carinata]|uniref:25S rRNA (uridine-N(3))-methyltransferase BMT5-like domain-containing protein n=1 Tax=Brassica carinata TaxID=52824 RepID=A0A8X7VFS1_BRACI|nr:hypothetical protein Bca52824_022240 [Brassica carinata]